MSNDPVITNVPGSVPPDQASFFLSVKRSIEYLMGQTRNTDQTRAVRVYELGDLFQKFSAEEKAGDISQSQEVPYPPSNLVVDPTAPFVHKLTWDNPLDPIVSHIEIWAAVNSQSRDESTLVGIVTVTEDTRGEQGSFAHGGIIVTYDYTYWIRSVSYAGVNSVWCPPDVQGGYVVQGEASVQEAIDDILEILNGQITENELYQDLSGRIDLIDGPIGMAGSVAARIDAERASRESADGVLASEISELQVTVDDNSADILAEQVARANGDSALASDISILQTSVDNNAAAIVTEQSARTSADDALAYDITVLQTDVGNNAAAILSEQTARADADSALASDISALQTSVGDNTAAISTEQTARSDADSALASDISTVQTTVNGHTTSIQTISESVDGLEGKYTVKIDANGYVSGFGFAVDENNGTPESEFIFLTDKFKIVTPGKTPQIPFSVGSVNGVSVVGIDGNLVLDGTILGTSIQAGSIVADHLAAGQVIVGHTIQSSNFSNGVSGWQISYDGKAQFNGPDVVGLDQLNSTVIDGGYIKTSLINASAIVIGDLSGAGSLAGLDQADLTVTPSDNQLPNPDFELGLDGWVMYRSETSLEEHPNVRRLVATNAPYGKWVARFVGQVHYEAKKYIPVSEGKTYFGEIWLRPRAFDSVDNNIRFYAGVCQYDYDKVFITNAFFIAANETVTVDRWQKYEGTYTIPAGVSYIRAMGIMNYQGTAGDGIVQVAYMRISEVASGADVTSKNTAADTNLVGGVPSGTIAGWRYGATTYINGGNIYTNTITATQIAAGTITANQLAANTVTAAKMATGTITAASGVLANAVITTAKIANLSVDTIKIANGAVTNTVASASSSVLIATKGGKTYVHVSCTVTLSTGAEELTLTGYIYLRMGTTIVQQAPYSDRVPKDSSRSISISFGYVRGASSDTQTYSITKTSTGTLSNEYIVAMETKK